MTLKETLLQFLLFIPLTLQGALNHTKNDSFLHELESARYNITLKYAPADWKKSHFNWDPDIAYEEAKAKLIEEKPSTSRQYQKIFRSFINSSLDYHVKAFFYSTECASIPLKLKHVEGRYYISTIELEPPNLWNAFFFGLDDFDIDKMFKELKKLGVGDEVVAINGTPVNDVVERLIDEDLGGDRTPTGYSLATRMLFLRYGFLGHDIPSGESSVTLKPKNKNVPLTLNLPWLHVPEWIKDLQAKKFKPESPKFWHRFEKRLAKDYSVKLAREYISNPFVPYRKHAAHKEENDDWRVKGFLPPLGSILWETDEDSDIYAYIYQNERGKRIGYLYLPHFSLFENEAEGCIDEYLKILDFFQQHAEALVLDITDNPGGNFFFMLAVLSTLTDKPLDLPTQMEILIQEDIYAMASLYNELRVKQQHDLEAKEDNDADAEANTLSGYIVDDAVITKVMEHILSIVKLWESGEKRTPFIPIFGLDKVTPHPKGQYTKPIILLTNEMGFSCADLFPAILQDNGRALLFGKKTAGAGGYVTMYKPTSQFGIAAYSLTGSLCQRTTGEVIENLGVTPDVPYEVTKKDIQNHYTDYIRAVNAEVNKLIGF